MQQSRIISAYKSLRKLADRELPIRIACQIHRLTVKLRPVWDFQVQEEQKLCDRLHPKNEDGKLVFETPEGAQEFRDRLKELNGMEVEDIELKPITIPIPDGITLTPADIEALEGFVEFEMEDDDENPDLG